MFPVYIPSSLFIYHVPRFQARLKTMSERMSTMTETDCGKIDQLLALEEERMNNVEAVKDRISSSQADVSFDTFPFNFKWLII